MAQITITTDAGQDARIAPAMGAELGLGRNATVAEVKGALITWLRGRVKNYERGAYVSQFTFNPLDPT
jgi:hypothetical protein